MKYIKYFEDLKFKPIEEQGIITITAYIDGDDEGWLSFQEDISNPTNIIIDDLSVNTHKQGLGTKLMNYGLNHIISKYKHIKTITLNASPTGFNIPLPKLIEFYQKFGFEISKMNSKNADMIKILKP